VNTKTKQQLQRNTQNFPIMQKGSIIHRNPGKILLRTGEYIHIKKRSTTHKNGP